MTNSNESSSPVKPTIDSDVNDKEDGNDAHNSSESEITKRLNQELALSTAHRNEIESHWRQVLRKEKFKDLHDEIEPLAEYHEQNIQRKRDVIQSSQREFDHLQELYRKAMVANIYRMDELISIYDDQVILLGNEFRERLETLQSEFRRDVDDINAKYDAETAAVRQRIKKQHQTDEYVAELITQDTQHEVEEIKNRNLENINTLRFVLDSKVEDVEEQFEQSNFDHAQNTDFTKAAYEQLKAKDTQMRKEILKKTRHADRLQSEIQRFQLIAKQEEAQNRERHQALFERKTRAIQKFQMTNDEMARFRKDQQQKLIILSRRAHAKKEALKQQCIMAERVKKIALMSHKWETSREQFASMLRDSAVKDSRSAVNASEADERDASVDRLSKQSILLKNDAHRFWDKYNMARLDVLTLEKKVNGLKRREQDLRKKIKMYQDGITVNDDVLKNRNPLLVINGKINSIQDNNAKVIGGRKVPRRLTVIDANHIVAINNKAR
ncbi:hypothetical protein ACHAWO_008059 [Cyclotella atomus]|uniref:Dynein regulatory complex subunit 2 n=1 Tax=Cyclotella atomus TaxID=382360 RepID=A0ABD3N0Z1_9STRA